MDGLINRSFSDEYCPTTESRSVVNVVADDKYLVVSCLEGISASLYFTLSAHSHSYARLRVYTCFFFQLREFVDEQNVLNSDEMRVCDLACLLYDMHDPKSFAHAVKIQKQLHKSIPFLFIATKSDLTAAKQVFCC